MKKIFFILLISGTVLFFTQLTVRLILTGYLESSLIPRQAHQLGIAHAEFEIDRPGLFKTAVGPVRLGNREESFLDISSIKLRYTPWGLINRHIKQVIVSGVNVNAAWQDNRLVLSGFSPAPDDPAAVKEKADGFPDISWPVSIGAVIVDNVMVNFSRGDDLFQLPLKLALTPTDKTMNSIEAALHLVPCGQQIDVFARLEVAQGRITARLEAPSVGMNRLSDWAACFPGLDLSGTAALSARADVALNPFRMISATVDVDLSKGGIAYRNIAFGPVDGQTPVSITVTGSQKEGWQVVGSEAALFCPVPFRFSGFECSLVAGPGPGMKQGGFIVAIERSGESPKAPVELLTPVIVEGDVKAEFSDSDTWQIAVTEKKSASRPTDCRLKAGDMIITAPVPGFKLSAAGTGGRIRGEAMFSCPSATLRVDDREIVISDSALRAEAGIYQAAGNGTDITGDFYLSTGKIAAVQQKVEIETIDIEFPFQWPSPPGERGNLLIGPLTWQGVSLGRLTGALQQAGRGVTVKGQYAADLLPGLKGDLNGTIGMERDDIALEMKFRLRHMNDAADIDPGRFLPQAAGIFVNADLETMIDVAMKKGNLSGRLVSRIGEGKIRSPEKRFAINGIKAGLTVPDLFTVKSDPGQKISFQSASFGDINVAAGEIDFQLESARTIFIEKSGFAWCRGSVYAEGMRISPDRDEYLLTLYSDRLNLAGVLSQIGAVQAEGEGTVSGRIPIRYAGGNISVTNGFLFSAPGEGGVIHLRQADILTAGLPENSAQYRQIDLAREALKSYRYDWAKVLLNSEGKNLHIKLAFDGQPTRSLPFVYDKKQGGFVRVAEDRQHSEFKGLSLDVNFTIPLNELIGYKEFLNLKP